MTHMYVIESSPEDDQTSFPHFKNIKPGAQRVAAPTRLPPQTAARAHKRRGVRVPPTIPPCVLRSSAAGGLWCTNPGPESGYAEEVPSPR